MIEKVFASLLSFLFPSQCFSCKKKNITLCDECLASITKCVDTPYTYITSIYSYRDPLIKKYIHAIKYFHRKDLILPVAKKLAEEIKSQNIEGVLIPIPMHWYRMMSRGYNHAEILANEISKLTSLPHDPNILKRKTLSSRQVKAPSRNERLANQKNTFTAKDIPAAHVFILIDDVTTTGATISEARKVLIQEGAQNVVAFTIAH